MDRPIGLPPAQGLYDPANEHDSCGVGWVANVDGRRTHAIVEQALEVLKNLTHRGATGCDPCTGDGAGILLQLPDAFLRKAAAAAGITLPPAGHYGAGLVFLPTDEAERAECVRMIEDAVRQAGQAVLGWREVPVESDALGWVGRAVEPKMRMLFVGRVDGLDERAFEVRLYLARKIADRAVRGSALKQKKFCYMPSLSCKTFVFKGLMLPDQVATYFPDLRDPDMASALALVHSRFSTNTFPTWDLAHPYRYVAHNGEINTLKGNRNWVRARQIMMESPALGADIKQLFPVVWDTDSDSASFDNVLELLVLGGRSLPHAIRMMIPEAWENHSGMSKELQAFYEYHASICEPWDGPAAMAFTDGRLIGITLDRNGLRPIRYVITKDGMAVVASEIGVLSFPPEKVERKGRISPGQMFLVNLDEKRVIWDEEIKQGLVKRQPYASWLEKHKVLLKDLPGAAGSHQPDPDTLLVRQQAFGYTLEDIQMLVLPMAVGGEEAVGSMGTDTPLACLSDRPQLVFNYFKQLFAQVTNPPIDPIREEMVMSLSMFLGPQHNLLGETPEHCHQLELPQPVLTNAELEQVRALDQGDLKSRTLSILFPVAEGRAGLAAALDRLRGEASKAVAEGTSILILSDRGISETQAAIPSLLATGAVHHHLIREGSRTKAGIVVETGEAREVFHFALLIGYGAGAINPYLAFETINDLAAHGHLPENVDAHKADYHYVKAVGKGLKKIMSKMGISTLQSYCGAQIFEAIGLDEEVVGTCFTGTPSRIRGVGLEVIAREAAMRHLRAWPDREGAGHLLEPGGQYHWRRGGERHLFNPETIARLQEATRENSYSTFKEYSQRVNDQSRDLYTLRGLFKFKPGNPVPIAEVEPATAIVKRFATGAMSFGSISKEAHETLARAMNSIGARSNTGEGGEDPERLHDPARRSSIKQVASGRFGVTTEYAVNADELQIKMAQGAKPGEGGQLPGHKVDRNIARVRHSIPGVTLISPPPHHDIYSIEDLAQLIHDLKNVNPKARISVKLVAEVGVGTVAAGVSKARSDVVLISGHDGGTGASPLTSIKHAGIPWELGLAETQQVLVANDLRGRIIVQADGQMKTGRDVAIAALLGAEEFGFASAPLVVEGCIMMRKCHLNTCPVGVATQDPELRKKFNGKPEHVVNFFFFIAEELREIMAQLGFRTVAEMVGRVEMLDTREGVDHWKAKGLDFSAIFHRPAGADKVPVRCMQTQDHGLSHALDNELIRLCGQAIGQRAPVALDLPIRNIHRTVGAMLSGRIAEKHGDAGLPPDTIQIRFAGSAGQSFGAFLVNGVSLTLTGDSNDYLGKAMTGGRIVVRPPEGSDFDWSDNVIVGNVVLYGATGGEAYFAGKAGERFCVRNSGAKAVVEGVGDHGCEYMTGGTVVVLGRTGRNFAAGMSGGVAFVWNPAHDFESHCNKAMVDLEKVTAPRDIETLRSMIAQHHRFTGSPRAKALLDRWEDALKEFVLVMPLEYRRVMASQAGEEAAQHG